MNERTWQAVRALFEQALELPAAARDAFVAAHAGDAAVLADVRALLAADTAATPAAAVLDRGAVLPAAPAPLAGGRIGGFVLQRVLGQGGMGTVWLAEQQQPRRLVALKVLAVGLRSETARRRFQFEAEMLGRLRHPGIAQVYEAAVHRDEATAMDVPYFAMELVVDAVDLVTFAHGRGLDTDARLELLLQLCLAVHHGHQHGVIHRDLKPPNVLVDADGRVVVIDFGIARCAEAPKSAQTLPGLLLGTVPYMSPEQLGGDAAAIDTRTDVWALGVIACELLTGQLPFPTSGLPPTRALERVRAGALRLPGLDADLQCIVQKALCLEPARRYASAAALADDLRAYRAHLPISARPPSAVYQLRKFARRHRGVVAAAAAVVLALASGLAAVMVQNGRIERQRQLALVQLARAERVTRFAKDVLAQSHALTGRGPDVTLRSALDDAARHVDDAGWSDPAVEAEIKDLLGSCYRSLSLPDQAAPFVERAALLRRQHDGPAARATMEVEQELALLRLDQQRDDEALQLLDELRGRCAGAFGEGDALTLSIDHDRALALRHLGRLEQAEALYRRTLEQRRLVLGADDPATLVTQHNLGVLLLGNGDAAAARDLLQDCFDRRRVGLGPDHPDTLMSQDNLGECWRDLGDPDRAIALHLAALQGLRQRLGDDQEWTLGACYHLLRAYAQRGDIDAMLQVAREALPHSQATFGDDDRRTLDLRAALAGGAMAKGEMDAAERQYRDIVSTLRRTRGAADPATVTQEQNLALVLLQQQRADDAMALLTPQLQRLDAGAEVPLPVAATTRLLHAQVLAQLQRLPEAEAELRALRRRLGEQLPAQHPLRQKVAETLAQVCDGVGKAAEATALRDEMAGR